MARLVAARPKTAEPRTAGMPMTGSDLGALPSVARRTPSGPYEVEPGAHAGPAAARSADALVHDYGQIR